MGNAMTEEHPTRKLVQNILLLILGGLALAIANLAIPFLSPLIAPLIGLLAFYRIFATLGKLSWRRDLILLGVVLLVFATIWATKSSLCVLLPIRLVGCNKNNWRADTFLNVFCMMPPLIFLWSFVRFRSLKHRLLKKDQEETVSL